MKLKFTYIPLGIQVSNEEDKQLGTIEHDFDLGFYFEDNNMNKISPYFNDLDKCEEFVTNFYNIDLSVFRT